MNRKQIFASFALIIAVIGLCATPAHAQDEAGGAADLAMRTTFGALMDTRATRLRAYLATHNSPMTDDAKVFVAQADQYNLDWKLVAAIAGTESTFGKHVPAGSYNGWGWGIPTGAQSGIAFADWKDGIHAVSEGLRVNYVNKGAITLDQIGAKYAASPVWAAHVAFFMNEIESFTPADAASLQVNI